jgi:chromosome segregation ATPase
MNISDIPDFIQDCSAIGTRVSFKDQVEKLLCLFAEIDRLRAELAKAQEKEIEWRKRYQALSAKYTKDCIENMVIDLREKLEAAEARCKELEEENESQRTTIRLLQKSNDELTLTLSGRTMCYDPYSYEKGRIAGMEEAERLIDSKREHELKAYKHYVGRQYDAESYHLANHAVYADARDIVRSRLKELKG